MKRYISSSLVGVATMWCVPLSAQNQTTTATDEIVVTGRREGTLDLPRLLKAQEAFRDGRHVFAPTSTLYFQFRASSDASLEGMRLELRSNLGRVPVPIDAAGRFVLPDLPAGDWELVHDRSKARIAVRALVISAGATETDRPLGDLRLQCRAGWELAKADRSFIARNGFNAMGGCSSSKFAFWFRTPRTIGSVVLDSGAQSRDLPLRPDRSGFRAPLGERSIPNAAMVHVRYD